jgi:hypothetical protein
LTPQEMLGHLPDEPISMPKATESGRYTSKASQPSVPPTNICALIKKYIALIQAK